MKRKIDSRIPRYPELLQPVFTALQELGGSGNNDEILDKVTKDLSIPDDVADISHADGNRSELDYQVAWAKTYLSKDGIIENSARAVWSINSDYAKVKSIDAKAIVARVAKKDIQNPEKKVITGEIPEDHLVSVEIENPDTEPWRTQLATVLQNMDPYGFERLSQRLLRECGFTQVEVTKKSGDGGIDGTGKLKINGIFSFNVAFQCKRYTGIVGASAIRDFRGSLTTDIEKGVFITTGTFSKAAREEASNPGKQQIDLIDGDDFISKIAEYEIGVHPVKTYEIDEEFFEKI